MTAAFSLAVDRLNPGTLIISDQFDNNALGWDLSSSPIGSAQLTDGKLELTVKWENQVLGTSAPFRLADFDLSVDVQHAKGPADSFVSIFFRHKYTLDMFVDGRVFVNRAENGNVTNLLAISPESSFQPAGVNQVRIIARSDILEFYRNDVLIGSLSQQDTEAGSIELNAVTMDEGGLTVLFDNLIVRVPTD